jgi:hypothetical protein
MALKSLLSRASRASVSTQDPALDRILTWLQNRDNSIGLGGGEGGGGNALEDKNISGDFGLSE